MEEVTKKGGNAKGVRTQKMMSLRIDNDLLPWLEKQPNKGRYINNLIRQDIEHQGGA